MTAATAEEAIKILAKRKSPIDLLLTDVVLPGSIQGNDLAARLLVARPDLPVLFMSGYTRDATLHGRVLDEGANFLEKPFSPSTLAVKLREMLDRSSGDKLKG